MQYYIYVILAAILFAMQFLCQQKYEEKSGTGLSAALTFSLYKGLTVIIMMLILSGFKPEFAVFSLVMSFVYALCYILMIYFSLKAFSVANLSVYSVFTMLGGMVLPFVIGVGLFDEKISVFKIACFLLVVIAVLMNIQKGESSKKAFLYYMLVFLFNGAIGAITTIHQNLGIPNTDSTSFMLYSGVWTIIICGVWLLIKGERIPLLKGENLLYSAGDGFLNGIGDLLLLISVAPGALDASVQYPFVTGGVMVFSTLISIIRHEKIRKIEYLAALVACVASVLMVF